MQGPTGARHLAARLGIAPPSILLAHIEPRDLETIRQGGWRGTGALPVDIPATYALDGGVWYRVRHGVRGLLVPDERGWAVCYVICEPASHYYRNMTGS